MLQSQIKADKIVKEQFLSNSNSTSVTQSASQHVHPGSSQDNWNWQTIGEEDSCYTTSLYNMQYF